MNYFESPVPIDILEKNYNSVPIVENGEELVELANSEKLFIESVYHKLKLKSASKSVYVRKSLLLMLKKASENIPEGYKLMVLDGHRSPELQKEVYLYMVDKVKNLYINSKSNIEISHIIKHYVSECSIDSEKPSPHLTGGSIDVTLCDELNNPINMGTQFDDPIPESQTAFFEFYKNDFQTFKYNRRLLYHVMISVGFTNYCNEWWHYDYGNQLWASKNKSVSIYSIVDS